MYKHFSGDRIVGINGLSVESFSYDRAVELLRRAPPEVTLLVSQPVLLHGSPSLSTSDAANNIVTSTPNHNNQSQSTDNRHSKSLTNSIDRKYTHTSTPNSLNSNGNSTKSNVDNKINSPNNSSWSLSPALRPRNLDLPSLSSNNRLVDEERSSSKNSSRSTLTLSSVDYISNNAQPIIMGKNNNLRKNNSSGQLNLRRTDSLEKRKEQEKTRLSYINDGNKDSYNKTESTNMG